MDIFVRKKQTLIQCNMEKEVNIQYLITNERDKRWGLTVSTVGYQHIDPDSEYPPKNHPETYLFSTRRGRILEEYVLLYIAHGCGYFSPFMKDNVEIKAGTMILLLPGEWHNYRPDYRTGWDEYWIGFSGRHADDHLIHEFFDVRKILFNVGYSPEIVSLYKNAIHVATEQFLGYQQVLAGIADLLLGLTYSLHKNSTDNRKKVTQQINQAKMMMSENFHRDITPEEIAEKICMSYSWFRNLFKKQTGLSPYQYMQELRIQKSKELLVSTPMTCQEIAYRVGYESPLSFSVVFKKKTGSSPNKYRNMYRKR